MAVKAKAHEVSSIVTSMLLMKNFAVQLVLRTGMWASRPLLPHSM